MSADNDKCSPSPLSDDPFLGIPADPKLVAQGWERRFLADPDRTREAIELYTSMGYEVKAQKLTPDDLGPNCTGCDVTVCANYSLIYTRKIAS